MKDLKYFLSVISFLEDEMTEEQASKLMDEAKDNLSISDIEYLCSICPSNEMYTQLDMYNAEMGGLNRY